MAANDDLQLVPLRLQKNRALDLTAALAAAPALTTLRTPLPALWAPAYAVVAANPRLGGFVWGTTSGLPLLPLPLPLPGKPAPPPRRSSFPSLSLGRKRPILPTALFLSSARRHARLSELVRAGRTSPLAGWGGEEGRRLLGVVNVRVLLEGGEGREEGGRERHEQEYTLMKNLSYWHWHWHHVHAHHHRTVFGSATPTPITALLHTHIYGDPAASHVHTTPIRAHTTASTLFPFPPFPLSVNLFPQSLSARFLYPLDSDSDSYDPHPDTSNDPHA
ncbi:hypothetical protein B0H13DRAFT_2504950 [Mycena leptocephala]|nr:hypothetical protein B0H13DRAFT_2504950 [Mycena leptocephala]